MATIDVVTVGMPGPPGPQGEPGAGGGGDGWTNEGEGVYSFTSGTGKITVSSNGEVTIRDTADGGYVQVHSGGSIQIGTNNIARLAIQLGGAWQVNGDEGTIGYVLTSNGNGASPTWQPSFPVLSHSVDHRETADGADEFFFTIPANANSLRIKYFVGSVALGTTWSMTLRDDPFGSPSTINTTNLSGSNNQTQTDYIACSPGDIMLISRAATVNQADAKVTYEITFHELQVISI